MTLGPLELIVFCIDIICFYAKNLRVQIVAEGMMGKLREITKIPNLKNRAREGSKDYL